MSGKKDEGKIAVSAQAVNTWWEYLSLNITFARKSGARVKNSLFGLEGKTLDDAGKKKLIDFFHTHRGYMHALIVSSMMGMGPPRSHGMYRLTFPQNAAAVTGGLPDFKKPVKFEL
jgi:hypothetical protein